MCWAPGLHNVTQAEEECPLLNVCMKYSPAPLTSVLDPLYDGATDLYDEDSTKLSKRVLFGKLYYTLIN